VGTLPGLQQRAWAWAHAPTPSCKLAQRRGDVAGPSTARVGLGPGHMPPLPAASLRNGVGTLPGLQQRAWAWAHAPTPSCKLAQRRGDVAEPSNVRVGLRWCLLFLNHVFSCLRPFFCLFIFVFFCSGVCKFNVLHFAIIIAQVFIFNFKLFFAVNFQFFFSLLFVFKFICMKLHLFLFNVLYLFHVHVH
jgi:hypothetical protein